jgi:hypothetical protein
MAVTLRGSRRIVVDGIAYRWLIRRKETWNDIHDQIQDVATGALLRVAIVQEDAQGALLLVSSDQSRRTKYSHALKAGVIQPSDVMH